MPLTCKSTPTLCERHLRESGMRKTENRLLQRWTRRSRWLLLILLPPWILTLVWPLYTVAPAVAKTKSRGVPTRHAPAKKEQPAPVLSYEKRLQKALELTQQNKWPQAIQIIGTLESASPVTPTVGRLWFLRAMLAQKLQDAPTASARLHPGLAYLSSPGRLCSLGTGAILRCRRPPTRTPGNDYGAGRAISLQPAWA